MTLTVVRTSTPLGPTRERSTPTRQPPGPVHLGYLYNRSNILVTRPYRSTPEDHRLSPPDKAPPLPQTHLYDLLVTTPGVVSTTTDLDPTPYLSRLHPPKISINTLT